MKWRQETKLLLWSEIVAEKIRKQRDLLKLLDKAESAMLDSYIQQIRPGDTTNREGHAAKVYLMLFLVWILRERQIVLLMLL